jgi:hypothetical protein
MHPAATLRHQAPPQPQASPQAPPQPRRHADGRLDLDHLWYGSNLNIPVACACCMGPAQTSVPTKWMRTSGRTAARVSVPYCHPCKWHRTWSGHLGVGLAGFLGPLLAAGGIAGGVLLGIAMTKDGGDREKTAGILAIVFMLAGFIVSMVLVGVLGRYLAPRRPQCTCRSNAVHVQRGRWVWRFRFTNPQFEDAFRSMNNGRVEPH